MVGGQQFVQIGNCFTIWKNLFLSISPSKHNCFKICKKCHAMPQLINLYLSFIFQICRGQCWPPKFPLCTVKHFPRILLKLYHSQCGIKMQKLFVAKINWPCKIFSQWLSALKLYKFQISNIWYDLQCFAIQYYSYIFYFSTNYHFY